jgi:hypothetical protein
MLGFKCFQTAAVTISAIELAAKTRKRQFKVGKLQSRPQTIPANLGRRDRRIITTQDRKCLRTRGEVCTRTLSSPKAASAEFLSFFGNK